MENECIEITVRGYHLDLFQHVNNARYLEFLEEARWSCMEHLLSGDELEQVSLAIVNINISYLYPARIGDVLQVFTELVRVGTTSLTINQRIVLKGSDTLVVDAELTIVVVDRASGRPTPLSERFRRMITGRAA